MSLKQYLRSALALAVLAAAGTLAQAGTLTVDATPPCGSAAAGAVEPRTRLLLSPAPVAEAASEYQPITAGGAGLAQWLPAQPVGTGGRSVTSTHAALIRLSRAYAGFSGFEFRLRSMPSVTAQCHWAFDPDTPGGGGGDPGGGDSGGGGDPGGEDPGAGEEPPPETAHSRIFVPVVLRSPGRTGGSFFTTELTLASLAPSRAELGYTYTAAWGGGSGVASDSLEPGEQRIIPDVLAYLAGLGLPIGEGAAGGTLSVSSSEPGVVLVVRVTTPVDEGRVGLSYIGIPAEELLDGPALVAGLRQNGRDRSNLAVQNAGEPGAGDLVVRVTIHSGDPASPEPLVLPDLWLGPGGFHQYNRVLDLAGFGSGYARVERVSGTAPFYCYGVVNDNFNSDGSLVFPVRH